MSLSIRCSTILGLAVLLGGLPGCQRLEALPFEMDEGDDESGGDDDGEDGNATGANQPTYDCHPAHLDDCPAGQKCAPLEVGGKQNVYQCVEHHPEVGAFEACTPKPLTGDDGCPIAHVCMPDDFGSPNGICMPMCKSYADCDLALCIPDAFTDVSVCADHCDPFEAMCASAKLQCLHTEDRFTCKQGNKDDVGAYGAPCDAISDRGCGPGHLCVQGEIVPGCASGFCCTTLCDLDGPEVCDTPATCNAIENEPPPGFEHIGACFVPF